MAPYPKGWSIRIFQAFHQTLDTRQECTLLPAVLIETLRLSSAEGMFSPPTNNVPR